MAYCTATQLQAAISNKGQAQLSADAGTTIDSTIVGEVISQASAQIDLYLGGRYTVPITSGTAALAYLVTACVKISAYYLLKRRFISGKYDEFRSDYEDTIEELKEIKSGAMSLPGITSTAVDTDPTLDDYSIVGSELQVYGVIVGNNRRASTYI